LNALILTRRDRPELLRSRRVRITVFDLEEEGPWFGARALQALQADGAPLSGTDVAWEHVSYDWKQVEVLEKSLDAARGDGALMIGSSEGGLFEYGSDDEIVDNLRCLRDHTPDSFVMVGSVTRIDTPIQRLRAASTVATRPRGLAAFRELVKRAGWNVTRAIERPFSDHVNISKA
jgi:hypothetical protein